MKNNIQDLKLMGEISKELDELKAEDVAGIIEIRKVKIGLLMLMVACLKQSNEYQELKIEQQKLGDIDFKIDLCEENLLPPAYGIGNILENKKKINELEMTLNELKERVN